MSNWPDKYVIGLTGNIATGKSVVRRMLEHVGAYSIDADKLAHRTIARGAPGYQPVIENFGKFIVGPDGEIDRAKLGRIVFSDPDALRTLENIVHPLVRFAMDILIQRAAQRVIVIEAIKLLEGKLAGACDFNLGDSFTGKRADGSLDPKNRPKPGGCDSAHTSTICPGIKNIRCPCCHKQYGIF